MVKKYWKDPMKGRNSGFVGEVVATEEEGTMKIVLEGKTDALVVCPTEICEVLTSMEGVELNWLIEQHSFDKAYYIHHLGGAEFHYRGFTLAVFGDPSIFLNGKELISDCPELLLEFQGELSFGENAWVKIIDENEAFCGQRKTFREAKEVVDEIAHEALAQKWTKYFDIGISHVRAEVQPHKQETMDGDYMQQIVTVFHLTMKGEIVMRDYYDPIFRGSNIYRSERKKRIYQKKGGDEHYCLMGYDEEQILREMVKEKNSEEEKTPLFYAVLRCVWEGMDTHNWKEYVDGFADLDTMPYGQAIAAKRSFSLFKKSFKIARKTMSQEEVIELIEEFEGYI